MSCVFCILLFFKCPVKAPTSAASGSSNGRFIFLFCRTLRAVPAVSSVHSAAQSSLNCCALSAVTRSSSSMAVLRKSCVGFLRSWPNRMASDGVLYVCVWLLYPEITRTDSTTARKYLGAIIIRRSACTNRTSVFLTCMTNLAKFRSLERM